jgi:hypothetical protein
MAAAGIVLYFVLYALTDADKREEKFPNWDD